MRMSRRHPRRPICAARLIGRAPPADINMGCRTQRHPQTRLRTPPRPPAPARCKRSGLPCRPHRQPGRAGPGARQRPQGPQPGCGGCARAGSAGRAAIRTHERWLFYRRCCPVSSGRQTVGCLRHPTGLRWHACRGVCGFRPVCRPPVPAPPPLPMSLLSVGLTLDGAVGCSTGSRTAVSHARVRICVPAGVGAGRMCAGGARRPYGTVS